MDEIVYNALCGYFHVLELNGYMSHSHAEKLLVLSFYKDIIFNNPRVALSKKDFLCIEKALDCLWGSTCLIPYPDYLKSRINSSAIVLSSDAPYSDSIDTRIEDVENRLESAEGVISNHGIILTDHSNRLATIESTKVVKGKTHVANIEDIDLSKYGSTGG